MCVTLCVCTCVCACVCVCMCICVKKIKHYLFSAVSVLSHDIVAGDMRVGKIIDYSTSIIHYRLIGKTHNHYCENY